MPELGYTGEQKIVLETATELAGEEVYVVCKKAILAEDVEGLDEMEDNTQYGYKMLAKIIISWNFTKDGQPAPITPENVAKVPLDDLKQIEDSINFDKQLSRLKKKSSSSSSPIEDKTDPTPPSTTSS